MSKYFLALVGLLYVVQASARVSPLDSLKNPLEMHREEDTVRVNMLNELSYQYQWSDFYTSLTYAKQALRIAEKLSYKKGIATAYYRLTHCYWALGDGELAIETGLKGLDFAREEQSVNVLGETSRILAMCYRDQQEIEIARLYIRQAQSLALQSGNWDLLARTYNTAGAIEHTVNNYDTALYLYNKGWAITETHATSKFHVSQILANMGEYYLQDDVDKGLEYFSKALQSAIETGNRLAEAGIMADLGRAYLKKEKFAEADKWLSSSLALSRTLGLKRVVRHAYAALVDLKLHEGKTTEAFDFMKSYYDVNDSLLNTAKTRQIVELENRYKVEQKEQQIRFLEQEKRILAIRKNVLIVGAMLVIVFLFAIYKIQGLRTKNANRLLIIQQKLNASMKEMDNLKSRFFANISHEFRTPLSLILAPISEKLSSSVSGSDEEKNLLLIQRNANRLLDLVNQLLDLSKLEANKMQLEIRQGDLSTFINVLTASFDSFAESKEISFTRSISIKEQGAWFDPDKVEKIIGNVLFNAFKFTPAGGKVNLLVEASDLNQVKICISDTGKGISPDEQKHIFSPFYQSKYAIHEGLPGTGLGLSLVNELVKLHKGKIKLTSNPTDGTTVLITLPIYKMDWATVEVDPKLHALNSSSKQPLWIYKQIDINTENMLSEDAESILIVEDNADLVNFIANSFRDQFVIHIARDGKEGFKKATELIPDLIVSDVMMPIMDGVELTEKLKGDERTSHIPIVLLTAKVDEQSRMKGFRSGADDYLPKPFSIEELRVRMVNLIEQRKKQAARFKESSISTEEPKELTIDEKFIRRARALVESNLSNYNFGVEMLAEEMNLSRAQLFRKFKALVNTSPSEFINDIRLKRAAKMIRSKADTLAQISYAVGFNEQSYFAKRFRKKFGVTPGEYASKK